jgi:hypothetical protein
MSSIGFIKRIIPFLATLTVGLFIASFFVDLAPRPFAFPDGRRRRCHDMQEQYFQEHAARLQAEQELDRIRQNPIDLKHSQPWTTPDAFVPPPPSVVRVAPRAVR